VLLGRVRGKDGWIDGSRIRNIVVDHLALIGCGSKILFWNHDISGMVKVMESESRKAVVSRR
jgi:hypothetical protein